MDKKELIKIEHISKTFHATRADLPILTDISLVIEQGEFASIIGKSGSGKTTLMNILGCLDQPTTGSYFFDGEDISKAKPDSLAQIRNQKIGFIFQTFNLLEDATALDNVALPLLYAGIKEKEARVRAFEHLKLVELETRVDHYPNQLSGGQRQRVAIARALINEPMLILADEPTGNLDSKTGDQIFEIFKRLNEEKNITFIIVTHDNELAHKTNRIIQLVDGKLVS